MEQSEPLSIPEITVIHLGRGCTQVIRTWKVEPGMKPVCENIMSRS